MRIRSEETQVLDALSNTYDALGGPNSPEAQLVGRHSFDTQETRDLLAVPISDIVVSRLVDPYEDDLILDPDLFMTMRGPDLFEERHRRASVRAVVEQSGNPEFPVRDVLAMGYLVLRSVKGASPLGATIIADQLKASTGFHLSRQPQPEVMAYTHSSLQEVPALLTYIKNYAWEGRALLNTSMRQVLDADEDTLSQYGADANVGQKTAEILGYERRFMLSKILYPYIAQRFALQDADQSLHNYATVMEQVIDSGLETAIVAAYPDKGALQDVLETDVREIRQYAQNDFEKSACTLIGKITRSKYGDPEEVSLKRMFALGKRWYEEFPGLGASTVQRFATCLERVKPIRLSYLPSPELAAYAFGSLADIPAHAMTMDIRRGVRIRACREGTMKSFPDELKSSPHELEESAMRRDYFRSYRRRFLLSKLVYRELGATD